MVSILDDEAYVDKAQLSQSPGSGSKNHTSSQHDKLGEITLNVYRIVNLQTICEKKEPLKPEDTIEKYRRARRFMKRR